MKLASSGEDVREIDKYVHTLLSFVYRSKRHGHSAWLTFVDLHQWVIP